MKHRPNPRQPDMTAEEADRLYPLPRGCWIPRDQAEAQVRAMGVLIREKWAKRVTKCPQCGAPVLTVVQRDQTGAPQRVRIDAASGQPWHLTFQPKVHKPHPCKGGRA